MAVNEMINVMLYATRLVVKKLSLKQIDTIYDFGNYNLVLQIGGFSIVSGVDQALV